MLSSLAGEDEVHMQVNATKFYEQNADRLMQLTSEDATSIIDFYQNMMFVGKINTEVFVSLMRLNCICWVICMSKVSKV